MNKVKRAIIMAAGIGQRMHPITYTTPKPLVKVNGIRMIDSIITALLINNITEIYIVVGHLKEQFEPLTTLFPTIKLIYNPLYAECNNISSLYAARDYIEDCIILDGDQIIYNPDILKPEFEKSGYNCIWTEDKTNEWLLSEKNGIITSCSRTGGDNGWQLFSVSRWSAEDGKKLKRHLEVEFEEKHNRQIYWDDVALFCYSGEYELSVYPMQHGDIIEIDNIDELAAIDNTYSGLL